jgi:DNA-binding PadR family transcriptional regulator
MILTLNERHIAVLAHLAQYRIYEDRPMPYATTPMGMNDVIPLISIARIYPALAYLEAAGLIDCREANTVGGPPKACFKGRAKCYQATPFGREVVAAYRKLWPNDMRILADTLRAASEQQHQSTLEVMA